MGINWDNIGNFERYPVINRILNSEGMSETVTFLDEGSLVSEEVLKQALKKSELSKGVKARDTYVFVVQNSKNEKMEFWTSTTGYTVLSDLKKIRQENGEKLKGAVAVIKRESVNDPEQSAFRVLKQE